jgi:succinate-semialdehyde dehydrogenase/glutarate-semialdehyde dehydrogenase
MRSRLSNPSLFIEKGYINGKWVESNSHEEFNVINPSTGDKIATLPDMNVDDVKIAAKYAESAFHSWKAVIPKVRGKIIRKWADLMVANALDLATLLTLEQGKPIAEAKFEVMAAASYLEFFAGEAERAYGDVIPSSNPNTRSFAIKQPIGVVACLTPWNVPAAMVTRKAGGAIAAGCCTILKPAGETPLTALAIAFLSKEAGLPPGVFNVITTVRNLEAVGKALCEERIIKKFSFTGSTSVGTLIMQQCSGSLKKLSLELGGNAPFIIFDDANIEAAINSLIGAKLRNSGQTCVSANRIFVQRGVYLEIANALTQKFKMLSVGDGFSSGVDVGPLTVARGVEKAKKLVDDAVAKGAKILHGGSVVNGRGNFFEPTLLMDMTCAMISHGEEFFSPVAALYPFDTEEEVIAMANDSDVGLGSYIITNNMGRMWRVAEALEVGMVGVNVGVIAAGELPFGGIKESGFGKEGGKYGVEEFMITKLVVVDVKQK